jgi:cytochrome c556
LSIPTSSPRTTFPVLLRPRVARALGGGLATLACAVLLAPAAARAADDEAWIKYRQTVMSGIGANMGGIGDILKNGLPLTASIEHHANALVVSSHLIAPAFQQKVVAGATDAKPEVWSQPEKFEEAIAEMQAKAEALAKTVHDGRMDELGAAVKALGKSCGGCHDTFRKPKEESYKNK